MPFVAKRIKAWKDKLPPGKQYPIDEALKLVKEKGLFGVALQLYHGTDIEHTLETMYGDYLTSQRQFFQAGVMYRRAGELTKAMHSFQVRSTTDFTRLGPDVRHGRLPRSLHEFSGPRPSEPSDRAGRLPGCSLPAEELLR